MPPTPHLVRFGSGIASVFGLAVGVLALAMAVVMPLVTGWRPVVITTGSMQPALRPGDVVLAAPVAGGAVVPGKVVVFDDRGDRGLITHRVVEIDQGGKYVTKGDANRTSDATPVEPRRVLGTGAVLLPMLGLPTLWFSQGDWLPLVALSLIVAAGTWCSRFALQARFDPWARRGDAR